MNFLQICQFAAREAGIPGGGPADVANQANALGTMVARVADVWLEIQGEKRWLFLRSNKTVVLTVGLQDYSIAGTGANPGDLNWQDLREIDTADKIIVTRSDGSKGYLNLLSWQTYRERYGLVPTVPNGPPEAVTLTPDGKLRFYPAPDAAHSIDFPYWKTAVTLTNKGDTPVILPELHAVIAWRAVHRYATPKDAIGMATHASSQEGPLYHRMMQLYLPPVECGPNPVSA